MKKIIFYLAIVLFVFVTNTFAQPIIFRPQPVGVIPSGIIEDILSDEANAPDFAPKITNRPKAKYTDAALEKRVSGKIILKAVLSADAKVINIEVVEKLPGGLTESAIAAAQKIKFEPALKSGKPVAVRIKLVFDFLCSCAELSAKEIKAILDHEQPWLSTRSQIFLANQLHRIANLSYYDAIQFAPELIKKGKEFLSVSEQEEYQRLFTRMTQPLTPEEQSVLQQFSFFSGREIAAEDRQKSNAVLRKGWDKLTGAEKERWRELHDRVVELALFPPRTK